MISLRSFAVTTALAFLAALAGASAAIAQTANVSRTDTAVTGTNVTGLLATAPGVMQVPNDGRSLLVVRGGPQPVTATIQSQKSSLYKEGYGTITIGNETVSIPSGSVVVIGPFAPGRFNTTSGNVTVSMSSVTGVSATAVRLP